MLLLGAMSVSVLLVILRQQGVHQSRFGQTLLIAGAVGEFLSILELTAYDLVSRYGLAWPLALAALKLLALLLVGYLALRGLRVVMVQQSHRMVRLFATHDTQEVGVRAALALMLCFAAAAVFLHVEPILATFIAGMVCSFGIRGRNALTEKLLTIGQGFFLPIFFITVGLSVNLRDLLHGASLALLLELLLAVLLTRLLAIPLLRLAGLGWSAAGAGALLLAAPLTLQVAIVKVGIDLGQVPEGEQGVVLAAAIVGAFVFPLAARVMLHPAHAARGRCLLRELRGQPRVTLARARAALSGAPAEGAAWETTLRGESVPVVVGAEAAPDEPARMSA
jgi:Kef-type K+ transport system membrane component KefB